MKKNIFVSIMLSSLFLSIHSTAVAGHGAQFLGPIAQLKFSKMLTPSAGGNFLTEVGAEHFRINATAGRALGSAERDRLKLSLEYLTQYIEYSFFTGNEAIWVEQTALGLGYEHLFDHKFFKDIDMNIYTSRAPSKNLSPVSEVDRRVAGSDAYGINIGTHFYGGWKGSLFNVAANYDYVKYDTIWQHKNNKEVGFGITVGLIQQLMKNLSLNLLAEFREPFNSFQASLDWTKQYQKGLLKLGIIGNFLEGPKRLPSTEQVGVKVSYLIDAKEDKANSNKMSHYDPIKMSEWLNKPSVYMPQVLAISESKILKSHETGFYYCDKNLPDRSLCTDESSGLTVLKAGQNYYYLTPAAKSCQQASTKILREMCPAGFVYENNLTQAKNDLGGTWLEKLGASAGTYVWVETGTQSPSYENYLCEAYGLTWEGNGSISNGATDYSYYWMPTAWESNPYRVLCRKT